MPRIMPREGQPSEKGNSPSEQGWAMREKNNPFLGDVQLFFLS